MDRLEALRRVLGMIDQIRSEWGVGPGDDDEEGEMLDALGATKAERAYLGVLPAGRWFEALVDIATALAEFDPGTDDFRREVDHLAYRIENQHPDLARRLRERYPHTFKGADFRVAEGHRPSGFVPFTIGWDDSAWPPPATDEDDGTR